MKGNTTACQSGASHSQSNGTRNFLVSLLCVSVVVYTASLFGSLLTPVLLLFGTFDSLLKSQPTWHESELISGFAPTLTVMPPSCKHGFKQIEVNSNSKRAAGRY